MCGMFCRRACAAGILPELRSAEDPVAREHRREARSGRSDDELRANRKKLLIAGAGILLVLGVAGKLSMPGLPIHINVDDDARRGPAVVEAQQVYDAFREDADAAEKRFADREMVVNGEFLRIAPDGYGSLDMRLKTSNPEAPLGVDLAGYRGRRRQEAAPGPARDGQLPGHGRRRGQPVDAGWRFSLRRTPAAHLPLRPLRPLRRHLPPRHRPRRRNRKECPAAAIRASPPAIFAASAASWCRGARSWRLILLIPTRRASCSNESACHTERLRSHLRPEVELTFHRHWNGRAPMPDDFGDIDGQPCAMCGKDIAPARLVRLRVQKPVGPVKQPQFEEQTLPLHFECLAAVSSSRLF